MSEILFTSATGHSIMILALVIAIGLALSKIKIFGISLAYSWVLFTALFFSAIGVNVSSQFLHYIKEFALVLFVYIIGLQAGPSLFSSFRSKTGRLNKICILFVIFLAILTTVLALFYPHDKFSFVGLMAGALNSTPSIGAAQQAFYDFSGGSFLAEATNPAPGAYIADAFALAYPIGIICSILIIYLLSKLGRKSLHNAGIIEAERIESRYFKVVNPAIFSMNLTEILTKFKRNIVVEEVIRNKEILLYTDNIVLEQNDLVKIDVAEKDLHSFILIFGQEVEFPDSKLAEEDAMSKDILISKSNFNGKKISSLNLEANYNLSLSLIIRSGGLSIMPKPNERLQLGDTLRVSGKEADIERLAKHLGNNIDNLEKPKLIPIFLGMALGVFLGNFHIEIAGKSLCLGLAGGPLVAALLFSYFAPKLRLSTYTTNSATLMLRELSLVLMLACIGLASGSYLLNFSITDILDLLANAFILAFIPMLLLVLIAYYYCKLSFYDICALVCGLNANYSLFSFAKKYYFKENLDQSYLAIYPLAMFFQLLLAQFLIFLFFLIF